MKHPATLFRLVFALGFWTVTTPAQAQRKAWLQSKAQWIWTARDGPDNTWLALRKKVLLSAKPQHAPVRLAAENKYWLYVNNNLVVRDGGLDVRPGFDNTYFDEVDIAPYLQKGVNVIAALVWHKGGKDGYTQLTVDKGGFLFEGNILGAGMPLLLSDSSWKVAVHPAFQPTEQGVQWKVVKWVAWPVAYDAQKELKNWTALNFNDKGWTNAVQKGAVPAAPWGGLVPRTIPFWKDFGLKPYGNQRQLLCVISGDTTLTAILNKNIQGTPYLKVSAPAGIKIRIWLNEFYWQEYTTRQGVQAFECKAWQNSNNHWVKYRFGNLKAGAVRVLDLKFRQTGYNTETPGSFSSSDTLLNKLWEKSKTTSYVCMRDIFFDCPNRERGQWWGDVSEQIMYSFYLYDEKSHLLAKKAYRELFNTQKGDGSLYTTAPGKEFHLPDQNLAAAATLWTYYLYTGDAALLRELYPGMKKFAAYCTSTANADGMLVLQPKVWNWIDWGGNMDVKEGSANTVVNAAYIVFLQSMKNIAGLLGLSTEAARYQSLQATVKRHFNNYFWSASKKAYVFHQKAGVQSDTVEDRSNAWAVLAGMVDDGVKKEGVLQALKNNYSAGPYQEMYVELALSMLDGKAAVERMRNRYAAMVSSWSSTLWEEFPAANSNNHAWSAGPVYQLSAYTLGVRPLKKAYDEFQFVPQRSGLSQLAATVPTPKGAIKASLKKTGDAWMQQVTVPKKTVAVVGVPKSSAAGYTITAGGIMLWKGGKTAGRKNGISFLKEDADFVYFRTAPGARRFIVSGLQNW